MRKFIAALISLSIVAYMGYLVFTQFQEKEREDFVEDDSFQVVLEDIKLLEKRDYRYFDDQIHFSVDFAKEYVDEDLYYDEYEDIVIFTDIDSVTRIRPGEGSGTVNRKEIQLITAFSKTDDRVYIPFDYFREQYRDLIDFKWYDNSLLLDYKGYEYLEGRVIKKDSLLASPHKKAAFMDSHMDIDEMVYVFAEAGDYYRVRTKEGKLGYIHRNSLILEYGVNRFRRQLPEDVESSRVMNELINLTWVYTYGPMATPDSAEHMPGVNVVSPTWFDVVDYEGRIYDKGNLTYSRLYSDSGYRVWPAVTNSFDPDMTGEILRSSSMREKVINDLLDICLYYQVDGINIDFENIYYEDRDYLTQFVRELYPVYREHDLVVSMDVTPRSTSPNWSMVYDRQRLHKVLDYMMIMAYDQHWAASPVAGSVAQYWWVEQSVSRILEQVPPEKVVLGMPFYSRVWDVDSSGVSSQAVTMRRALDFIDNNEIQTVWDKQSMQYYGEIQVGETSRKIWLENEKSLYYKTSLVHKYKLAGVATWRKGFEIPTVWESIDGFLN